METSLVFTLVIDQVTSYGRCLPFTMVMDLFTCADNVSSIYLGHRSADKFGKMSTIYYGNESVELYRRLQYLPGSQIS